MILNNLPEIEFVSSDKEKVVADVISLYTAITGRELAQGDPVRLFLLTIADLLIQQRAYINYTGKQNLLRYATGDNLDHIGVLIGVDRLQAAAATTTVKITLSQVRDVNTLIPKGTRVTAGDNVFFALDKAVNILAGEKEALADATCTEAGSVGNGYAAGELKTIVDPVPFVESMVNTTRSEGGADKESDESYREAIHEAPEQFSTAGPEGAYEYHAKRASALIRDVAVFSPEAGKVTIVPLLDGGEVPGQEIKEMVLTACNDKAVRPLTDYVSVEAPKTVNYSVKLTYYIDKKNEALAEGIQQNVNEAVSAYILWQKSKLGRDVNPSELIARVMYAGAKRVVVQSPVYTALDKNQVAIASDTSVNMGGIEIE